MSCHHVNCRPGVGRGAKGSSFFDHGSSVEWVWRFQTARGRAVGTPKQSEAADSMTTEYGFTLKVVAPTRPPKAAFWWPNHRMSGFAWTPSVCGMPTT